MSATKREYLAANKMMTCGRKLQKKTGRVWKADGMYWLKTLKERGRDVDLVNDRRIKWSKETD